MARGDVLSSLLGRAAAGVDRAVANTLLSRSKRARQASRAEGLGHEERMRALDVIRDTYDRPEHYREPDRFFAPPAPLEPELVPVRSIAGGRVLDARWPSDYAPFFEPLSQRYLGHAPNRTAHARVWLHDGPPRPAVVLVHGYRTGHFALEERVMPVSWMYARGLDVALFVLPFHAARATPGRALFPSSDPRFSNEGFRQAMLDLRALVRWLRGRGAPGVGALGMSLGGYTVSLLATIEDDLRFLVPVIPLASIADFARDGRRYVGSEDEQRQQHAALEGALRVVSPFARTPKLAPERVLVIAGDADRITPVAHGRRLAEHFQAPLETFPGGHLLQFGRAEAFRSVGRLLHRLDQI